MPVLRVREIYYLIETGFWFICVRIHWALPGILHRKSSVWRVLCTSLSLHRASPRGRADLVWATPARLSSASAPEIQHWQIQLKDPTQLHFFVDENSTKRNVSEDSSETVPEAGLATKSLKWNSFGFVFLVAPYFQKNSNVKSVL